MIALSTLSVARCYSTIVSLASEGFNDHIVLIDNECKVVILAKVRGKIVQTAWNTRAEYLLVRSMLG